MLRRNNSIILARVNRRPTPGVASTAAPAAAAAAAPTATTTVPPNSNQQQEGTSAKKDNSVDWSKAGDVIRKNSGVLFAAANLYGFKTNILSSGMELFGDSAKAKEEAEKKRLKEKEEAEEREWQKAVADAEEQEKKEAAAKAEANKKAEAEKKSDWFGTDLFSKEKEKPKEESSENYKMTVTLGSFIFLVVALWYSVRSSFAEARYKEQLRKEILEETKKILREEQENKDKPKSKWFG